MLIVNKLASGWRSVEGFGGATGRALSRETRLASDSIPVSRLQSVPHAFLELREDLVDREAGRLLPRRESAERRQKIANELLDRHQHEGVIEHPVPVSIGCDRCPLKGVRPEIVDMR